MANHSLPAHRPSCCESKWPRIQPRYNTYAAAAFGIVRLQFQPAFSRCPVPTVTVHTVSATPNSDHGADSHSSRSAHNSPDPKAENPPAILQCLYPAASLKTSGSDSNMLYAFFGSGAHTLVPDLSCRILPPDILARLLAVPHTFAAAPRHCKPYTQSSRHALPVGSHLRLVAHSAFSALCADTPVPWLRSIASGTIPYSPYCPAAFPYKSGVHIPCSSRKNPVSADAP